MDREGKGINVAEHPGALEALAEQFATEGWVHVPRLGVPPQCRAKVQMEADMLQKPRQAQRLAGGTLSQGMTNVASSGGGEKRPRTDSILFLDFQDGASSLGLREQLRGFFKLDQILERVVCQLASQLEGSSLGLCLTGRTRTMFARYEPGGYYLPHVDADDGDDRVLTAVYYLNPGWRAEDGGALRLHPGSGKPHFDVLPEEDALVLFRADRLQHEVCRSKARRLAVTVWFKGYCGGSRADANGTLARTVLLRRLPDSLQASPLAPEGGTPWMVSSRPPVNLEEAAAARLSERRSRAAALSDSEDDDPSGTGDSWRGPVLVCWNVVGFRLRQGTEKLSGLFVAAKRVGVRDHFVVSYPEDYGVEGEGTGPWPQYVSRLCEAIDAKPRRAGRPLILFAHSAAAACALSVAKRLQRRVLKVYLVDGAAPEPGGQDPWEGTTAMFRTWSDAQWILALVSWNPGSTVLREMAGAVLQGGWDVSKSKGAQEVLSHGKRQYLNAIHPNLARDVGVIPAPIFAFSMALDDVVSPESVKALQHWTSGGFHMEVIKSTHMGWLEPAADSRASMYRFVVFDRICEDMAAHMEYWRSLAG